MAIEPDNPRITVSRQCEVLDLARSNLYYRPCRDESYNDQLMRLIDEQYMRTPFYGVRRMTESLRRQDHPVNPKRVRRLMRQMGLEAIYPKPRRCLSQAAAGQKRYPYLLRGLEITRPDQVWAADITYVRMYRGWLYLVAILDWFSRCVLSWEVSVSLEADFCVAALERALATGRRAEIFNSDQGCQFTCEAFTGRLEAAGVRISMDGRGRVFDNIFIERLWRSVKYEEVYLKDYQTVAEARLNLGRYFAFYDLERPHQSLDYRTPAEVYGACPAMGAGDAAWPAAGTSVALRAPSVPAASAW
jgi:putative transposase